MPLPEKDIYYFIEVTLAYLNKIAGNEVVLRDPTIEFQSLVFSAYTGLIHLQGKTEGFVYVTTSQHFLQNLHTTRHPWSRFTEENAREVMTDLAGSLAQHVQKHFGSALQVAKPQVFSTVPDDPIEMPPAVFVQPLIWRNELAYIVLGLGSPESF